MQITINGKETNVREDETILDVANRLKIDIPTLCYDSDLEPHGSCRMCMCEVNGKMMASCMTKVNDGMNIQTETTKVRNARKLNLELLLSKHSLGDDRRNKLIELKEKLGVDKIRFPKQEDKFTDKTKSIVRDNSKCILCGKCINKCQFTQTATALCFEGRGVHMTVKPVYENGLAEVNCVGCGQCVLVCPTGAIREVDDTEKVQKALDDPKKHVVVQTAPAVRVAIGEEFGMTPGTIVKKQMITGLRDLGFDKVFDTNFTADLTIMEEGTEFINRVKNGGTLPLITSCSPGWIKFAEHNFPNTLKHLSTCKSPQQMFGAVAKTYYAEKNNVDPKDMVVVSIMPCTAKKYECDRPEMDSSGYKDVDYVLTTRELAKLLKKNKIDLPNLKDGEYDDPLGESTGAAVIFGASGGVMEAALRTAYEILTETTLENVDFQNVRGLKGIKEATVKINDLDVKVAIANGLGNARKLMEDVEKGTSPYHFIEIMACPGGCLGGGGQPIPTNDDVRQKRMHAIYEEDKNLPLRKSHENESVKKIYKDFFGEPNSKKSHELLHTKYTKRNQFGDE